MNIHIPQVVLLSALIMTTHTPAQNTTNYPPPRTVGDPATFGRGIQRTMTLLANGETARILFYGQSITEQAWVGMVADDLRKCFPRARLIIENRALGGFSSQRLVKPAEVDLYPFYPDLLIFYVFGSHTDYEDIIRRTRERTTAEILLQTDHLSAQATLEEEMDPARLAPEGRMWSQFMNYKFLPDLARRYDCGVVDQRNLWKQYLRDHNLPPAALLQDGIHLNDHGCYVMAEIVKAYLVHRPDTPLDPFNCDTVRTYVVGRDIHWQNGQLRLEFTGNRVDLLGRVGASGAPADVRIDGRKPSAFPELYGFTRAVAPPDTKWPFLLKIGHETPLVVEEWTLRFHDVSPDLKTFRFTVTGSKTGPDGEGTSAERFVSKSGRIVIEPADWDLPYVMKLGKRELTPEFHLRWRVVPYFVDEFHGGELVTVAQGLANTTHTLEITGNSATPLAAIRIYRPPRATLR